MATRTTVEAEALWTNLAGLATHGTRHAGRPAGSEPAAGAPGAAAERVPVATAGGADAGTARRAGGDAPARPVPQADAIGSNGDDTIVGTAVSESLDGLDGNDELYGLGGDDTLRGGNGNDLLDGGEGFDLLEGGAGNDTLDGGIGLDPATGEPYFDIADYRNAASAVTVSLATGVASSVSDGTDTLISIDGLYGSAQGDSLTGGSVHDGLWGEGGNDTLRGGGGGDYLAGGAGNDALFGEDGNDELDGGLGADTLDGGNGTDVLQFWSTYGLTGGAVVDLQAGSISYQGSTTGTVANVENVQGTIDGDTLRGNALANLLQGFDGDDFLFGRGGADLLEGGEGNDQLFGADGNSGVDVAGDGADTLRGGNGNDILRGNLGADLLEGAAGDDNLRGDAGNDTLDGGDGYDFASYTDFTPNNAALGVDFDLSAIGSTAVAVGVQDGRGGIDTVVRIERFGASGTNNADRLIGSQLDDQLVGNGGDDLIVGNAGIELMLGGDGNDTLFGAASNDGADFAGDGADELYGGNGDDLLRGNLGDDLLYGEAGDDNLRGDSGNDTLDGGDGYDFASYTSFTPNNAAGGADFDLSAIGDTTVATLVGDGRGGVDSVVGIERFGLTGTVQADWLRGSQIDDQIIGNLGDDTLSGNAGDDVYYYFADTDGAGGLGLTDGFDILVNDDDGSGFDTLVFAPATSAAPGVSIDNVYAYRAGTDLVLSLQRGTDWDDPPADPPVGAVTISNFYTNDASAQVDRVEFQDAYALVGLGADAVLHVQVFDLAGNLQQNALAGVGGNDVLVGTDGRDLLDGGAGDDTLDGGLDDDTAYYVGNVSEYSFTLNGDGSITVVDSQAGRDGTDIVRGVEFGRFADGTFAASDLATPPNGDPTGSPTGVLPDGLEDTAYIVSEAVLLQGFSDPDGDPLSAVSLNVDFVSLTDNGDGTWTYHPDANFNGSLTLSYEVVDSFGNGVDATLDFIIAPVNDTPVAVADGNFSTPRFTPISFNLLTNDTDIDIARGEAQTLVLTAVSAAGPGAISFTADGQVTYTPPGGGYSGTQSFSYTLNDGAGGTAVGSFSITVRSDVIGTPGNDTLTGTAVADSLYGLAGDDLIDGRRGRDTIEGGDGDDTIVATGNDLLKNDPADGDLINAGAGSDTLRLGANANFDGSQNFAAMSIERLDLAGKTLTTTVVGLTDLSGLTLVSTSGKVQGSADNNIIVGTSGNDWIDGQGGADNLSGGLGDDTLIGGAGPDGLNGGDGADTFRVGGSELDGDRIDGGAGVDTLLLKADVTLDVGLLVTRVEVLDMGNKSLFLNVGSLDLSSIGTVVGSGDIVGNGAVNFITGTQGGDGIRGGAGNDVLRGAGGDDSIYGGAGNDSIYGGSGNDRLYGGDSRSPGDGTWDVFVFNTAPNASTNVDTIFSFEAGADGGTGIDKIMLDLSTFMAAGLLDGLHASEFLAADRVLSSVSVVPDANDYILYDTRTGSLYYDPDGSGYSGAAPIEFAVLNRGTVTGVVDYLDFMVGYPP